MIKESHIIQNNCIACNKKFGWEEVVVWKMPENVWFCLPCCEKYEDPIEYDWIYNVWIPLEYTPWIKIEFTGEEE